MRRLIVIALAASALVSAPAAAAESVFVLTGRGWGHSVGMSQWGAYGYARQGAAYETILTHYYRGSAISVAAGRTIGVLLADGRTSLTVGSAASFQGADGGKTVAFPAGTVTVTKTATGAITAGAATFASPVTFSGTAPLRLGSTRYRGTLVVSVVNGRLRAVNRVALESYVKGVVPRESPDRWGNEGAQAALEAQAVAARSYALASGGHCGGGLFCPDTSDQVYGGYDAEASAPNATAAVDTTAGKVVTYDGAIAKTYFHSSSGGRTAASVDVWGGNVPYLQSEPDFDLIPQNPHRLWSVTLTARTLASRLGTPVPRDATLTHDASGLAQTVTVSGPGWSPQTVTGSETLRSRLGVKSARILRIGVLGLEPARSRVVFRERVGLSGLARGLGTTYLERRRYGGTWTRIGPVSPAANGSWSATVTPRITTDYRVVSAAATGIARRVSVAARVSFYPPQTRTALRGLVRPRRAGATVAIQRRRADGRWATIASTTTNASGEFAVRLRLTAGAYRGIARVGAGYVRGVTPVLHVA